MTDAHHSCFLFYYTFVPVVVAIQYTSNIFDSKLRAEHYTKPSHSMIEKNANSKKKSMYRSSELNDRHDRRRVLRVRVHPLGLFRHLTVRVQEQGLPVLYWHG